MPTILVADDNSNIQKMVCLAVKDLGVDVVSVGNGEAAVHKLNDLLPDLILADIFMPVRSGYEVCEFVKHNPRLASIPVVLLTGAFDPFDEKEAQRVGADGVLKKPFVPPDPLLAMVKNLLDRAAVPVGVPVTTSSAASKAAPMPAPPLQTTAKVIEMPPPVEERDMDPTPEEPAEDARAAFPSGTHEGGNRISFTRPFAPSVDVAEPEPALPSPVVTEEFRSWTHSPSVDTSSAAVANDEETARKFWESDAPTRVRQDEAGLLRAAELEQEYTPTAQAETPTVVEAPPSDAAIPAPESLEHPSSAAEFAETPAPVVPEKLSTGEEISSSMSEIVFALLPPEVFPSLEEPEPAVGSNPAGAIGPQIDDSAPAAASEPELPAPAQESAPLMAPFSVDPGPADFDSHSSQEKPFLPPPMEAQQVQSWSVPPPPDPALIEAVVDSVIERMQPQIMDIVTREILRPVIEALVRREFENKK